MNNSSQSEDWLSEFLQFAYSAMKDEMPASEPGSDSFDAFNMPVVVSSSSNEPLFDVEKRINSVVSDDKLPSESPIAHEMTVLDFPSGIMDIIGNRTCVNPEPMSNVALLPTEDVRAIGCGLAMDNMTESNLGPVEADLKAVPPASGFSMNVIAKSSDMNSISRGIYINSLSSNIGLKALSNGIEPRTFSIANVTDDTSIVYPIYLSRPNCSTNDVNIEDIGLYLECTDDNESADGGAFTKGISTITNSYVGTSFIKSDARFKISFPIFQEERHQGIKCSVCKHYFPNLPVLSRHITEDHRVNVCLCSVCSYNTKSKKLFENHMKTKHKLICNVTGSLDDKQSIVSMEEVDGCLSSSRAVSGSFKAKRSLVYEKLFDTSDLNQAIHTERRNDRNVLNIDHQEAFATISVQDESVNIYPQPEERHNQQVLSALEQSETNSIVSYFKCPHCDFTTQTLKLLKRHNAAMHNADREILHCLKCDFSCKQKRSLISHNKIHDRKYDFRCEKCCKVFTTMTIYKRHLKIHDNFRSFSCDFPCCGKLFKLQGMLTDHKKKVHGSKSERSKTTTNDKGVHVNLDEEAYMVEDDVSGDSRTLLYDTHTEVNDEGSRTATARQLFTIHPQPRDNDSSNKHHEQKQLSNLVAAKNVATSKKKFRCFFQGCDKLFRDNFNLRNHLKRHTGVKDMRCPLCDFACIQKASLQYHIKNKHQENLK